MLWPVIKGTANLTVPVIVPFTVNPPFAVISGLIVRSVRLIENTFSPLIPVTPVVIIKLWSGLYNSKKHVFGFVYILPFSESGALLLLSYML